MLRGLVELVTWAELTPPTPQKHVVLVAASGLGKTSEMRQQARRLVEQGRLAVFLSARSVLEDKVEGLDLQDERILEEIRAWMPSSTPPPVEPFVPGDPTERIEEHSSVGLTEGCPVVFVDAVDEVVLAGRNVQAVVRMVMRLLGDGGRRCQWVVSARGGWSEEQARSFLHMLGPRLAKEAAQPGSQLRDVTFESLDDNAVRELAKAAGCRDLESFLKTLRASEIESHVELRPMDVARLVARWNRVGTLGSWTEIYDDYVRMALEALPEPRDDARTLTVDAARHGAERVGAATVFAKTPFVSVPTIPTKPGTVGSRELFADWTTRATRELFETALFHKKGDDSLQLQPGEIPSLLAAAWLTARARGGKKHEWLRDRLMVRVFGEDRYALPESRRATAGWVASFAPEFRRHLEGQPSVTLYEGDPERLSDGEVLEWLDRLLDRLREDGRPSATHGTVLKLARPSLEAKVVSRLAARSDPDARQLLCHWAVVGRYTTAIPIARAVALNVANDTWLRVAAIGLIAACEDEAASASLETLVAEPDEHVRDALAPILVPHLRGDALVDFLRIGGTEVFPYHLRSVLEKVPDAELELVLERMLASIRSADGDSKSCFAVALAVLVERLRRSGPQPGIVVEVLLEIEASSGLVPDRFVPTDVAHEIGNAVVADDSLRRALWMARFEDGLPGGQLDTIFRAQFGHQDARDIDWLIGVDAERPEIAVSARVAARALVESLSDDVLAELRLTAEAPLLTWIEEVTQKRAVRTNRKREHEADQRRDEERVRADNLAALEPRRVAISRGEDVAALVWAWQRIVQVDDRDEAHSRLTRWVGSDIATDFVRGIARLWRLHDVDLPDPDDRTSLVRVSVALAGIGFEVADGLDFWSLEPSLAGRAARYALYELNELPPWFAGLLHAHERVAVDELRKLVTREWTARTEPPSILRFAPYAPAPVAGAIRSVARDLLMGAQPKPPINPEALDSAVTAVLTAEEGPAEDPLRGRARAAVVALPTDDARRATWLRLWAYLDPIAAAKWLATLPATDRRNAVVEVAAAIERDFKRRDLGGSSRLMAPAALQRWAALLYGELPPDGDERPNGLVKPRHDAQDLRDRCVARLYRDPSLAARAALEGLASAPEIVAQPGLGEGWLAIQYASAVEHAAVPWSERTILALEQEDEVAPRSLPELFALVRRHLDDLACLLETDEFSYRSLFRRETAEREIQLWAASSLRLRARGLYAVVRENVVDDDKEVDITVAVPGVGQIPIEIKPVHPYSLAQLKGTIRGQLLEHYMSQPDREVGVLLLVAHGPKRWKINGKLRTFGELLKCLQDYADEVGTRIGKEIAVHGIDIESSRSTKSKRAKR